MRVEKEGTKSGGGYVGGFFHLFEWTSKSRKKLFATKSDVPVDGDLAMTRPYMGDEDEIGGRASVRGSGNHSYASSVTDDEVCGTKVPGVVARLMGLDSLPSSDFPEPYSTPYFDTRYLQETEYRKRNLHYQHDQTIYSGNLLEKVEGSSRNIIEPKPQKTLCRPIEKFQTEVLPPKSAKSIPVTHHKLLSPIKNPGFVPTNNAAYIMEAAARIIEPGPQATAKPKTPLIASSSVSLKVRDLKEKVEASQKGPMSGSSSVTFRARDLKEKREVSQRTTRLSELSQKSVESNAAKYLKGQSCNKSWNGSVDVIRSTDAEEVFSQMNKGKSISLAIQAKVNVQRREGLSLSGSRSLVGQKEHHEVKLNPPSKTNVQKNLHKKSSVQNASGLLRQNNRKQNCSIDKSKLPSKPLISNSHDRKILSGNSSYGRHRSSTSRSTGKSKAGSRKSSLGVTDCEKEILYTSTNNFPRKKRSTDKDWNDRVVDNLFIDKTQKPVQSNLVSKDNFSWAGEVRKKDMDVVSFTFSTPLTRNSTGFGTSGQVGKKTNGLSLDNRIKRVLLDSDCATTPVGYNVIGSDPLGFLLEQKLRELTYGVETSCSNSSKARTPSSIASNSIDLASSTSSVDLKPRLQQKDQDVLFTDTLCTTNHSDISPTGLPEVTSKHKSWIVDGMKYRGNHVGLQLLNRRHPSPISVLEPSFSTESCESLVSTDATSSTGESKSCSSVQTQEVLGLNSLRKFYPAEADTELSDSASSTSTGTITKKQANTLSIMKFGRSSTRELDYVKEILYNVELMFMDYALGRAREIVNPHLFSQLETRKEGFESDDGEPRIRRKVIFDCVSECMDLKCRRYASGGYKMWAKGVTVVRKNERLSEEVYREICGWGGMGDSMVDELVDRDMSSQYGRWLDFDVDAFELGVVFEDQIFDSLVNDVVAEILQS